MREFDLPIAVGTRQSPPILKLRNVVGAMLLPAATRRTTIAPRAPGPEEPGSQKPGPGSPSRDRARSALAGPLRPGWPGRGPPAAIRLPTVPESEQADGVVEVALLRLSRRRVDALDDALAARARHLYRLALIAEAEPPEGPAPWQKPPHRRAADRAVVQCAAQTSEPARETSDWRHAFANDGGRGSALAARGAAGRRANDGGGRPGPNGSRSLAADRCHQRASGCSYVRSRERPAPWQR